MTQGEDSIEALRKAMEDAASSGNFELAASLRDRISILRGAGKDVKGRAGTHRLTTAEARRMIFSR